MENQNQDQRVPAHGTYHFQTRLWERHKVRFTPEEITFLEERIRLGEVEKVSRTQTSGTAVFKYIHRSNVPGQQLRIYVVADVQSGRLVTVLKPKWRHKIANKSTRQKAPKLKRHYGR